jgi:hypothetical protein
MGYIPHLKWKYFPIFIVADKKTINSLKSAHLHLA